METTSGRLTKNIFPLTLMATRRDCGLARACNPGKDSVDLVVCSPASRAIAKAAHECCDGGSLIECAGAFRALDCMSGFGPSSECSSRCPNIVGAAFRLTKPT